MNRDGYPGQDGKGDLPARHLQRRRTDSAEAGAAGFTVTHAYNAVRVATRTASTPTSAPRTSSTGTRKAGCDALHGPDEAADRGRLRTRFRHRICACSATIPALLAWDEEEGFARGDIKPETLKKIREILRKRTRTTPSWSATRAMLISRVKKDRSDFFPARRDGPGDVVVVSDPASRPRDRGNALQGEEGPRGTELVPPTSSSDAMTDKPIWVGVQSYKKPQTWARYPNATRVPRAGVPRAHQRREGADVVRRLRHGRPLPRPEEGHWDDLKRLAGELHGLADVFMAPFAEAPKPLPDRASISVALKRAPDRHVLLAANRRPDPVEVAFRLAKAAPKWNFRARREPHHRRRRTGAERPLRAVQGPRLRTLAPHWQRAVRPGLAVGPVSEVYSFTDPLHVGRIPLPVGAVGHGRQAGAADAALPDLRIARE